jgi:hypothetical protein
LPNQKSEPTWNELYYDMCKQAITLSMKEGLEQ